MQRWNKTYAADEHEIKFQNFQANLQDMKERKMKAPSAEFAPNQFSDMSKEEFGRRLNKIQNSPKTTLNKACLAKGITAPLMDTTAIPASFDWRQHGKVTAVKDQGQCGSCWAFSTIGNIESQWAIGKNKLEQFSEQLLVDCSTGCAPEPPYGNVCNQGCDGGWQWNAFGDIVSWGGVMSEKAYPYTAVDGTCMFNKKSVVASIKNYTCLSDPNSFNGADENQMAAFLVSHGPISIAMDADFLMSYTSGVIDPVPNSACQGTQLDHALLIVGYGVDSTKTPKLPFWIVKNSWSADWGEKGYFRIIRGQGACGLNNAVSSSNI